MLRGFGEWLEEDPIGRFCMLNRRNYTRNGHVWNPMPDMELESLSGGGGGRIFGRGVREKGTPRTPPPGYGPGLSGHLALTSIISYTYNQVAIHANIR